MIFPLRRALSVGVSVCLSLVVQYYFSFSHEYWMPLTALLMSQTTRGTPIKQGMNIYLIILVGIIASSLLILYIKNHLLLYVILSAIFICSGCLAFCKRPLSNQAFFLTMVFFIVVLLATLSPTQTIEFLQYRLFDATIGGLIGILSTLLIFPVKLDTEFSAGIIPILNSLMVYSKALTLSLKNVENDKNNLISARIDVENALQASYGSYPEWVYEFGFNRGLRSGFRYFLLHIEQVTEVYFSIDFIVSQEKDKVLLQNLYSYIENTMQKNQELLLILSDYFKNKTIGNTQSDFTTDMSELEQILKRVVPSNLEVLDISPSFLQITAFVRDLRDLRGLLLQLVMSLPNEIS